MERAFFNTNMSYIRVVPLSNGSSWSVEAICRQITDAFIILDLLPDLLIVWLDREKRTETAEEIADTIRTCLMNIDVPANIIHIMVCDMMSENVLLADEAAIRHAFNDQNYTYVSEGLNGKHILKTMYKTLGVNYKEMFHGVQLMKRIRLSRARLVSPSVDRFLQNYSGNCWWVN